VPDKQPEVRRHGVAGPLNRTIPSPALHTSPPSNPLTQTQGVSYALSTIALPSLALLPSASRAAQALSTIQERSTRRILTLASISSLSLLTCYTLASPRGKHPYLLWTALVGFVGGQGVEWWFNGFSRFGFSSGGVKGRGGKEMEVGEKGYVQVEQEEGTVNGERVEAEMAREARTQNVRTVVGLVGFLMGVVGIWGDGA
jgi:autophagy-related protein 33